MSLSSELRHAVQIARVEHTRSRRQSRSSTWQTVLAIGLIAGSVVSGIAAYVAGRGVASGRFTIPVGQARLIAVTGALLFAWTAGKRTARVRERVETGHLLTTVRVREATLGVLFDVCAQVGRRLSVVVLSVAVGFGLGTRSPVSGLAIVGAVASLVALAVVLGVAFSFAAQLVTLRSPRLRRYRNYTYLLAFVVGLVVWLAVVQGPVSNERLIAWSGIMPFAWFVDLALVPTQGVESRVARSIGAVATTVVGVPLCSGVAGALAGRVWTTDRVRSTATRGSRSLVGPGFAERVFAGWVPRPVLTVARKRWLQERRVPVGLLSQGYLLVLTPVVYLPVLATGTVLRVSVVALAPLCAVGTALAFGVEVLGTEYESLPMTLTAVSGRQFVQGTLLAGTAIGAPVTVILVFGFGVWSPLGVLELVAIALIGVVLSVSSVLVAAVFSFRAAFYDLFPVSVPLTDMTVYTDRRGFFRLGVVLALVSVVCLPAVAVYSLSYVGWTGGPLLDPSSATARAGALLVTLLLAGGVAIRAYRQAVRSFDAYTIR